MTKRVFIALALPPDIVDDVFENIDILTAANKLQKINWVKKEGIHITLNFLGRQSEAVIDQIDRRLKILAKKTTSFKVRLAKPGGFPNLSAPQVIWLGVDGGVKENKRLIDFQRELKVALKTLPVTLDKRVWRPHITLGRGKNRAKLSIPRLGINEKTFPLSRVQLIESELTTSGANYNIINEYKLRP